jgi:hypothetical protein
MPIDKAKIAEWEALAVKATPGPWRQGGGLSDDTVVGPDGEGVAYDLQSERDAPFVAAAREAVPALLSEREEREAVVERLTTIAAAAEKRLSDEDRRMLDGELNRRREAFGAMRKRADDAEAERASLLSLLREVEWNERDWGDADVCPFCKGRRDDEGHKPDCRLAAFLREGA